MVREGLPQKVTQQTRLELVKGANYVTIWGRVVQRGGIASIKNHAAIFRDYQKPVWLEQSELGKNRRGKSQGGNRRLVPVRPYHHCSKFGFYFE